MKKVLTILALSLVATSAIFAKTAQVQLITNVAETPVSYELAYDGTQINDGTTYDVEVAPLTSNGQTKDFTINASSNMNSDLVVSVKVSAQSFKTTLNNGSANYDSNITPSVNTISSLDTLVAGKHTNQLVNKFNLSWSGNSDLPAGAYTSNVKVEYSIQ